MATSTTLPVQQLQGSTYNHPCADLLDGGRRREYDIAVPLYRASMRGNMETAKLFLEGREYLVRVDMELQNGDGNTAFCLAAISGNVDMVKIMVEKNQALPNICGSKNMMLLYLAAFHGNHDIYDVAIRILEDNKELPQDKHSWDVM
ncbi:hypothetical protein L1987_84509 [Smallanthus sonchifolius]|uniref:Uncharacterized protein n=2 Tax=Smallanthus sonchifolius TaxID=185202 RepID=A0ACB8YG18_9ASTR|nr:hypothetical protein L1987_84503 [Smallanthus sonchifolius]KAI3683991.1 hypothetical protein L1987_84509 [Smallanthus sonchifolius]